MLQRLVDFPQLRQAPSDVLMGLRRLDPTTELVYFGEGKWLLGRVRPNQLKRKIAVNMLDRALKGLSEGQQLSPSGRGRIQLAILGLQGFAPIQTYDGDPTFEIVHDFERALWHLANTTDDQLFASLDEDKRKALAEARADLRDEERARAAWKYMFTLSHLITRPDTSKTPVRAGFKRIKTIGGSS